MTDIDNLNKRREYIKKLLDNGEKFYPRDLARQWNSSYPAIMNDISVITCGEQFYTKNPVTGENTRARKLGVYGELTSKDWNKVLEKYNHTCANCGSEDNLTIDHIVPLSMGGTNTSDNIQPLCKSCNSKKGGIKRWKGGRPRKIEAPA